MAEAALPSYGFIQGFPLSPLPPANPAYDHLSHAIAPPYGKRVLAVIDHEQLYLSPVVGIDRPRRIDEGNSMLKGQAAPGSYLGLVADRKGNNHSRGYHFSTARHDRDLLIDGGANIHAGGLLCHIPGQRQVVASRQLRNCYFDLVN